LELCASSASWRDAHGGIWAKISRSAFTIETRNLVHTIEDVSATEIIDGRLSVDLAADPDASTSQFRANAAGTRPVRQQRGVPHAEDAAYTRQPRVHQRRDPCDHRSPKA
jgi:hypothetical protein